MIGRLLQAPAAVRWLLPLVLLAALPAQAPDDVVAHYQDGGQANVVTVDDLAQELGSRFAGTDRGDAALDFLINVELIRRAAEESDAMPSEADTQAWIEKLERRLQGAGMDLRSLMARKGMTRDQFHEYAELQLAQERMVRKELALKPEEEVQPEMLQLWLKEARSKRGVETDRSKLPAGIVARIGGREVTELELGRMLVRTVDVDVRQRYIRQLVLKRRLGELAKEHGIVVSPDEMKAEVEQRRRNAEADPSYQGVSFEDLLQAQGTSPEELAHSPTLRAQIEERRLVEELLPDAEIDRQLREERDEVLRHHGARRHARVLVVRAKDEPAQTAAKARVAEIADQIVHGKPFEQAARAWSDDPYTKVGGGDIGWIHRDESRLPEAVVGWVFEAKEGAVSDPIVAEGGVWLAQCAAIEEPPNEATLRYRMREAFAQQLRAKLLEELDLKF